MILLSCTLASACVTPKAPESVKRTEPVPPAAEQAQPAARPDRPVAAQPDAAKAEPAAETVKAEALKPKGEPAPPQEKKERTVVETLFLLVRETTVVPDGSISDISTFTYDKDVPLLLKKETVDSHMILLETTVYEYNEDRVVLVTIKDGAGKLKSQRISTYTPEGLLESETLSGKDGKVVSVSRYQYDDRGNRVLWSVFDGSKVRLGATAYLYQEGRNVRMDIVNAAGKPERSVFIDYDDGRRARETYRLPSGETEKYTVFAWKDGRIASESAFRAADQPVSRIEYAYDGDGNARSVLTYDRTGALTLTRKREYAGRTMTHVVQE